MAEEKQGGEETGVACGEDGDATGGARAAALADRLGCSRRPLQCENKLTLDAKPKNESACEPELSADLCDSAQLDSSRLRLADRTIAGRRELSGQR